MKKWMSLLVALALLTAGFAISAYAAEDTTIAVEQTTAEPGEEFTLQVAITGNPGFAAAKFSVTYDADALTLVGVDTKGHLMQGAVENDENGAIAFAAAKNVTGDGVLFTVTFRVNEQAAAGDYAVSVEVGKFIQESRDAIAHTVKEGGVKVAGNAAADTPNGGNDNQPENGSDSGNSDQTEDGFPVWAVIVVVAVVVTGVVTAVIVNKKKKS